MAVSENETSDCNSDSSLEGMAKERKEKPITKVIIRRLPPSMSKDTFLEQVSPLPEYDYMYFVKADLSLGEYAFSRAYINFKNSSDIYLFKERFDNYVFLDSRGNEFTAVVEFAPFSRIPKRRNKNRTDPKLGSIETDPIYLAFVESLNTENDGEFEEKPEYNVQPTTEEEKQKITNTPLLDFIKQRRIDRQKIREEKREERKRREIERKRYKEDERRRKTKSDSYPTKHISKNVQILNTKDSEDKKEEKPFKERKYENKYEDRKYEDRKYERKYEDKYERKPYKDDRKYTSYSRSKDLRKTDDYYKKPASKIKLRFEKTDKFEKTKPPYKKEDSYHKKNDYTKTEEEKIEKKVKKYSERREEHRNEIKKLETQLKKEENIDQIEDKNDVKEIESKEENVEYKKSDSYEERSELSDGKENDPRSQRRIRNKDRPAMPIYQPGMGFRNRNKGEGNKETDKKNDSEKSSLENLENKAGSE